MIEDLDLKRANKYHPNLKHSLSPNERIEALSNILKHAVLNQNAVLTMSDENKVFFTEILCDREHIRMEISDKFDDKTAENPKNDTKPTGCFQALFQRRQVAPSHP